MLLQPSSLHQHVSLSSTLSYSRSLPSGFRSISLFRVVRHQNTAITCSISRVRSYGTMDYERRSMVKWNAIFRRISLKEGPEKGAAAVLNQYEKEGRSLNKWELSRIVKELRKFKKFKLALEVYDWMNNREERFRVSTSDTAIQLDLIAKVHGIPSAEDYFIRLPDRLKDKRIYGALLNVYVRARMREKAELLMNKIRNKGYAMTSLPFNVMMTLYMHLKEHDKVELMISEMMEKNIQLDPYSYNIWLSSRGSQGSAERMEQVFEQMKLDRTIIANWTTFSTMATMYCKLGQYEKAEDCLKKLESRIVGRNRTPYHYLISLYGSVGKEDEVYRVWNVYKLTFPSIPNTCYHAVISSLVRVGNIEGAKKIYEDWLSVKSTYDPRIGNLFIGWYVREGFLTEAQDFFDHMVEVGGRPNPGTWEILAEGHIQERRIPEALSCLKEAVLADWSNHWKPKPTNVLSLLEQCEQEADQENKEVLMELLRQRGCLENKAYLSRIGMSNGAVTAEDLSTETDRTDDNNDNEEAEDNPDEMIFESIAG
ncbi:pentatricopeptide repeat-containing protein At1g02150 [Malania oleifera]|uniref:pentatricopeptide repeat-containing protein At1g02150 n=1 Tax=Malania oleifera TaxID=397392 RepID=UPI0025ADF4A9|nr:pentatricopeptide repeat-containing protein At1g02150 [Malania oleifera]